MKSKIKGKDTRFPSPFETIAHKTERTAAAILMHWMRDIIEKKNLDLGLPDVETSAIDRKMPDLIIYETRRSQRVLCVIEAKPPYYDVFNEKELKEPARKKATTRQAKYFCVTNFKTLIWYNTEKVNLGKPEEEQIIDKYHLSQIENLDDIEQTKYSEPIKKGLEEFLVKLYAVSSGKEPETRLPIDEFLVFRIYEKIKVLSTYYRRIIEDSCHKDSNFASKLKNWFVDQGWSFSWQPQDFDKAARQTAYLLVNKILFYNLLQAKRPQELDPLEIPESLTKGALLQKTLQAYFEQVLKIDYESIYTTDFIDSVAFPDEKEVVQEIKELINILKRYDFSKLGYDVIGRIFERLIPIDERHNLGQYFTSPDIVDLILSFCLHHEDDKILDPACGAGTFLVRAYQLKKLMNQRLKHEKILETLWGVDIAKFPAHLSTINLAINDLSVDKNYPNIIQEDFFALRVGKYGFELEEWRKARAKTLKVSEREVVYPRWFDAIVGNPPYTRQEEIPEIGVDKEKLIENALKDISGEKLADISKRAGIHAYFFVHGTKFLKDGGYFGFIVSNSWLDVEYGKGLQEFFLKNYKIIAIIESKVERWFEEADINTCIVVLQKCKNEKERNENLVRFVYLKKPLRNFIPPAQDMWETQIERKNKIDELRKTILAHNEYYENEELRIFPKKQKELWDEGFDSEEEKYVGAKWGKYLRAPEIFFKILEKGKDKLVPLKDVAEIIGGIITGNNDFFYFKGEKIKEVEEKFLKPVIKSPRDLNKIVFTKSDLKYKILVCDKSKKELKGTKVLKYIQKAEEKNIHKAKTFENREPWYSLPIKKAKLLWPDLRWERHICHLCEDDILFEHLFYGINPKKDSFLYPLCLYLNSTLAFLFVEIIGRTGLGGGAIRLVGTDLATFPCIKLRFVSHKKSNSINKFLSSQIGTIFEELGASTPEEVSLDKVKKERRELDKIVMGEILGLTEEEQLEVYKAVVDLVKSRIEKAKSVKKKQQSIEGVDIEALKNTIIQRIDRE
jgi:type I restriction-modification system DNA methylase subunit